MVRLKVQAVACLTFLLSACGSDTQFLGLQDQIINKKTVEESQPVEDHEDIETVIVAEEDRDISDEGATEIDPATPLSTAALTDEPCGSLNEHGRLQNYLRKTCRGYCRRCR